MNTRSVAWSLALVTMLLMSAATVPSLGPERSPNEEVLIAAESSEVAALLHPDGTANSSIAVGAGPLSAVYDRGNGLVYVANFDSDNLSIIGETKVIASVTVGANPVDPTYDPLNGNVYVANSGSANVSVVAGLNLTATISVLPNPEAVLYNPSNGLLYILIWSLYTYGAVVIVKNTTVIAMVGTGYGPAAESLDSFNGYVYVANKGSDSVTVIDGTASVSTIHVGSSPDGIVYDGSNGFIYVFNSGSGNASVIDGFTVRGSVRAGGIPSRGVFDESNGNIYVAGGGFYSNVINVLNGLTNIGVLTVGTDEIYPYEESPLSFVSGDSNVYVTNYYSDNVTLIHNLSIVGSIPVGQGPSSIAYDSDGGRLYVANEKSDNVTVLPTNSSYSVTFRAGGIPEGTLWGLEVGGLGRLSQLSQIDVGLPNGSYTYRPIAINGFQNDTFSHAFVVNGSDIELNVSFSELFEVTMNESGLPNGTDWTVQLGALRLQPTPRVSLVLELINGTYSYSASSGDPTYAARPGAFAVTGRSSSVQIAFSPLTYSVTFHESGLPQGMNWDVTIEGVVRSTDQHSIEFGLVNGSYSYIVRGPPGWVAAQPAGELEITGTNVSVVVPFEDTFGVTFLEEGLHSAYAWSVSVNGTLLGESETTELNLSLANGTYTFSYRAGSLDYRGGPGILRVNGSPVVQTVQFTLVSFVVTFVPKGLPANVGWLIEVQGVKATAAAAGDLVLNEANGTYAYFGNASDRRFALPAGNFAVIGKDLTVNVPFAVMTYPVSFSEDGLGTGVDWTINFNGYGQTSSASLVLVGAYPNGSYPFEIEAVWGFAANQSGGEVRITGEPVAVEITFTPVSHDAGILGLSTVEVVLISGGSAAAVAAACIVLARKRGQGS